MTPRKTKYEPLHKGKLSSTDYCVNGTLEHKEEGQHTRELIAAAKDAPSLKIIGEEQQEGKGEEDNCNTTPPMPHHL